MLQNLAYSCNGCNGHKYNKSTARDPIDGTNAPLFHPRKQDWMDHFSWNEEGLSVIGMTPTGRATVEALKLNRPELINLRMLLLLVGEHPPKE